MTKEIKISAALLVVGLGIISGLYLNKKNQTTPASSAEVVNDTSDKKIIIPDFSDIADIKEVKEYINRLQNIYKEGKSTLPLDDSELDSKGKIAQNIALESKEFLSDSKDSSGKPLHSDIMRVLPAISSMLSISAKQECKDGSCYIVEKYNFATNTTSRAVVNVDKKSIISIKKYPNMQPDISNNLTKIAKAIALKSPEIIKELGHTPTPNELSMANVRTSLKESPCEDKNHLCVAPTFANHQKEMALWAIVDLTSLKLAAAKWAGLGKTYTPACIDERTLQNRYIMKNFCQKDTTLNKDGWSFIYHLTGSDGLEIRDILYKGKKVAKSLKIVDWHVAYKGYGADKLDTSNPSIVEGRQIEFVKGDNNEYTFGYNDAMGCPMFSTSVVLAFNGPQIKPIIQDSKEVGFSITQDFRNPKWPMACNYRYQNRFDFYKDGSFRVVGINLGRGCSNKAIYRPVMRLDIDSPSNKENFSIYQNNSWQSWSKESMYQSTSQEELYSGKYLYKIASSDSEGYYIEPNRGQFKDNSRGDHERVFVSKYKESEGDEDLLTLGSCCKLKEDGVESYINGESIDSTNLVIWYVPKMQNDDREGHEYCWSDSAIDKNGNPTVKLYPCIVGPKFTPISKAK